ncbi:MAG: hypothetical protein AB7N91_04885 [Candidatus Tectimicrobiota bacterium]
MRNTRRSRLAPRTTPCSTSAPAFDWLMAGLAVWLLGGAYVDGWAHTHGRADTSFFTPWHALLYAGFLAVAVTCAVRLIRSLARRQAWWQGLPPGYQLSLLGVGVFWLGGVGDLAWHSWFGIEKDVEALLSPTHLLLAAGAWLIAGGPFRAAWQRRASPEDVRLWQCLPCWVSLTCMLSACTFILQIAHPVASPWGGGPSQTLPVLRHVTGVVSALCDAGLLMGFLLLAMRRWLLPPGTLTLVIGLNAAAMGFVLAGPYPFGLVLVRCLAAGLLDIVYALLQPTLQRPWAWRLFAFLLPVCLSAAHFGALALGGVLWWSVHLWTGTVALTGVVGVFLSFLLLPPVLPMPPEAV